MPFGTSGWGSGDGVGWRGGTVEFRAEPLPLVWRGYCSGETSWMKVAPSHPARIKAEPLTKIDTFMSCEIGKRKKMFEGKWGIVKNYFGFPKNSFLVGGRRENGGCRQACQRLRWARGRLTALLHQFSSESI